MEWLRIAIVMLLFRCVVNTFVGLCCVLLCLLCFALSAAHNFSARAHAMRRSGLASVPSNRSRQMRRRRLERSSASAPYRSSTAASSTSSVMARD